MISFAKCKICSIFKAKEKVERDASTRRTLQKEQDLHLADVEMERRCYYANQCRAECEPETYLSVITDAADQSDHELPHWSERSHATDSITKQKLHVFGALSHGRKAYAYTLPPHVRQGHNTTIEVLWRIMNDVLDTEKLLPPVLLLQLDNTCKSNKGSTVFSFLFLLVRHKVFQRIIVTYLPVGHTHEDIDQMFIRFAITLRKNDAVTRTAMGKVMVNAFTFCGNAKICGAHGHLHKYFGLARSANRVQVCWTRRVHVPPPLSVATGSERQGCASGAEQPNCILSGGTMAGFGRQHRGAQHVSERYSRAVQGCEREEHSTVCTS